MAAAQASTSVDERLVNAWKYWHAVDAVKVSVLADRLLTTDTLSLFSSWCVLSAFDLHEKSLGLILS